MKIYLAAMYSERFTLRPYDVALTNAGHVLTSKWVWNAEESMSREEAAQMDVDDVRRADVVLSFTRPRGSYNSGGGRHFEAGLGYALGKRLIFVGEREIVFHHLPSVEFFNTFEEAYAALGSVMK